MVSLQYEFSDEFQAVHFQQSISHRQHIYMVSLQDEISDEMQGLQSD